MAVAREQTWNLTPGSHCKCPRWHKKCSSTINCVVHGVVLFSNNINISTQNWPQIESDAITFETGHGSSCVVSHTPLWILFWKMATHHCSNLLYLHVVVTVGGAQDSHFPWYYHLSPYRYHCSTKLYQKNITSLLPSVLLWVHNTSNNANSNKQVIFFLVYDLSYEPPISLQIQM